MNGKNVSEQSKGLNLKMNLNLIETEIQFEKVENLVERWKVIREAAKLCYVIHVRFL